MRDLKFIWLLVLLCLGFCCPSKYLNIAQLNSFVDIVVAKVKLKLRRESNWDATASNES